MGSGCATAGFELDELELELDLDLEFDFDLDLATSAGATGARWAELEELGLDADRDLGWSGPAAASAACETSGRSGRSSSKGTSIEVAVCRSSAKLELDDDSKTMGAAACWASDELEEEDEGRANKTSSS